MLVDLVKENGFTPKIPKADDTPHKLIDTGYSNDIALLANSPIQAESWLHSLEPATGGIGLHVNADKMEFMSFNQKGVISTRNGGSLKLEDKFISLRNSISATENVISM